MRQDPLAAPPSSGQFLILAQPMQMGKVRDGQQNQIFRHKQLFNHQNVLQDLLCRVCRGSHLSSVEKEGKAIKVSNTEGPKCVCLLVLDKNSTYRWALNGATVDVFDDIVGVSPVNIAADRLSCAQNLLDSPWREQDHKKVQAGHPVSHGCNIKLTSADQECGNIRAFAPLLCQAARLGSHKLPPPMICSSTMSHSRISKGGINLQPVQRQTS